MAQRAGSSCRRAGCPGIVRAGVCSTCGPLRQAQQGHDDRRGSASARGYGRHWQKKRLAYLRAHPLCVQCADEGLTTAATDVDHIVAKRNGGTDDEENLQALCHMHHSRKTAAGG